MARSSHEESFAFFCRYLEEDLDTPLCKELQQHLQECPECRHNLLTVRKTIELYRKAQPQASLSPEAKKRLLEKVFGKKLSGRI